MSDQRLRELQRRWESEPSDENGQAYLYARLRHEPDLLIKIVNRLIQVEALIEKMMSSYSRVRYSRGQVRKELHAQARLEDTLSWLDQLPSGVRTPKPVDTTRHPLEDVLEILSEDDACRGPGINLDDLDIATLRALAGLTSEDVEDTVVVEETSNIESADTGSEG